MWDPHAQQSATHQQSSVVERWQPAEVLTKMTTAASQNEEDCPHHNSAAQNPHAPDTHAPDTQEKSPPLATPTHSVPAPPLQHTPQAHTC